MKYLFLVFSFMLIGHLNAQFVSTNDALSIIETQVSLDQDQMQELNQSDPIYSQLKNNIKSYSIAMNHIRGGVDVAESIMMSVLEFDQADISVADYNNDTFPDPEYLRIKNHMTQLLED